MIPSFGLFLFSLPRHKNISDLAFLCDFLFFRCTLSLRTICNCCIITLCINMYKTDNGVTFKTIFYHWGCCISIFIHSADIEFQMLIMYESMYFKERKWYHFKKKTSIFFDKTTFFTMNVSQIINLWNSQALTLEIQSKSAIVYM